jgi:hypothetical protein
MLKVLVEIVFIGIALGLTVEICKPAIPYLPLIWFVILAYYTWKAITSKYVLSHLNQIRLRLSPGGRMFSYVVVAISGAALFSFYWWGLNSFLAPKIVAYEAEQRKKEPHTSVETVPRLTTDMQPTFREKVDMVTFEFGGNMIAYKFEELKKTKVTPFIFGSHLPVTLYVENNILYADIKIYGGLTEPPIEIVHNEFTIRRPGWDKNYNREALEIVDEKHKPMFQLIYKTESHIVINGIFPFPGGVMLGNNSMRVIRNSSIQTNPNLLKDFTLKRIFKYPSSKYLGKLDDVFKPGQ